MIEREQEFLSAVRARLGDKRYNHSLCVADEARKLASRFGADEEKAYIAGILHDILKDTDLQKQRDYLALNGIHLEDYEMMAPKLWHAVAGAFFVRQELGVDDVEIIDAIRYHTTGRRYMTTLDKVLYVSDFISKDRSYEGVDFLREKAGISLEYAMLEGLKFTISKLARDSLVIHPDTIAAYNQTIREVILLKAASANSGITDIS